MDFHNRRTPGEMIERIDGDVTALANFFSQFVIQVLGSALLLLGAIVDGSSARTGASAWRWPPSPLLALIVLGRWRDVAVAP